jgi:hypothetical protein
MQPYTVYFIWKLLSIFRAVPPPIIRSANNYIYSIWYLSYGYCYLPLSRQVTVTVWQIIDAVDTVVCAPDDGWWFHPKHIEQFPDKTNCVTLHLVGYILKHIWLILLSQIRVLKLIWWFCHKWFNYLWINKHKTVV